MIGKIIILCCGWALVTSMILGLAETKEIRKSAIVTTTDSGCSTHPHKVIEQKQIKDTYNYDSLGGEG